MLWFRAFAWARRIVLGQFSGGIYWYLKRRQLAGVFFVFRRYFSLDTQPSKSTLRACGFNSINATEIIVISGYLQETLVFKGDSCDDLKFNTDAELVHFCRVERRQKTRLTGSRENWNKMDNFLDRGNHPGYFGTC